MKVLVTGGAGYVGSHCCKALAAAGHDVVVYDNLSTGHEWAVHWGPLEVGDILDGVRLRQAIAAHKPDAVMHFAALAYVGESVEKPDLYYRTNVGGLVSVLEAMRDAGVGRIVFSSTCATYGTPETVPITEREPQDPINPYGRSKLMCEHVLRDQCAAYGLSAVALRYFNAAGASPDGEIGEAHDPETHLIPLVLEAAAGIRTSISILGDDYPTRDGTCVRDYIHVADLASAHLSALELTGTASGLFEACNLGTENGFTVREIIDAAERITGKAIPVTIAPRRPGDPPELVADAGKARELLGWQAQVSDIDNVLAGAWRWLTEGKPAG